MRWMQGQGLLTVPVASPTKAKPGRMSIPKEMGNPVGDYSQVVVPSKKAPGRCIMEELIEEVGTTKVKVYWVSSDSKLATK